MNGDKMERRAVITIIVEQNEIEPKAHDYTVEDVAAEVKDAILRLNYDAQYFNVIDQSFGKGDGGMIEKPVRVYDGLEEALDDSKR